jgi:hypothetical protein
MTVRRGLTPAAVAVLVTAAAAVLVTLGRSGLTSGNTPSPSPAAAVPAITGATWPFSSPAPTRSDSALPTVRPGTPAAAETADVVPAAAPAPFVQQFADGPTASPLPKQKSPTAPLKVPAFVDGCDHNYGARTQCVPLAFPDGVTGAEGKCAWLAAHGFTDLMVAGRDSQGLDADGDGVACD